MKNFTDYGSIFLRTETFPTKTDNLIRIRFFRLKIKRERAEASSPVQILSVLNESPAQFGAAFLRTGFENLVMDRIDFFIGQGPFRIKIGEGKRH